MTFISEAETYQEDFELFQNLGLKRFKTDSRKKFIVGEYKLPHYEKGKVKISVTCLPAQFWEFEVETIDGKKFNIKTGSGTLSNYWDSVLKVAEDMFVVNPVI